MKNKIEIKTDDVEKILNLDYPSNILPRPERNRPLGGDEWNNVNSDLGIWPVLGTPDPVPLLTHVGESSVSEPGSTKILNLVLHSPFTEPSSDAELRVSPSPNCCVWIGSFIPACYAGWF